MSAKKVRLFFNINLSKKLVYKSFTAAEGDIPWPVDLWEVPVSEDWRNPNPVLEFEMRQREQPGRVKLNHYQSREIILMLFPQ